MSLFSVKLNISFILIISFPFLCKNCPIIFKAALCGFLATRGQNNSKAEKQCSFLLSFLLSFICSFFSQLQLSIILPLSFLFSSLYLSYVLSSSFFPYLLSSFFHCFYILPSFLFLLPFTLIFLFIGSPSPFLVSYIVFYVMHVCLHL